MEKKQTLAYTFQFFYCLCDFFLDASKTVATTELFPRGVNCVCCLQQQQQKLYYQALGFVLLQFTMKILFLPSFFPRNVFWLLLLLQIIFISMLENWLDMSTCFRFYFAYGLHFHHKNLMFSCLVVQVVFFVVMCTCFLICLFVS